MPHRRSPQQAVHICSFTTVRAFRLILSVHRLPTSYIGVVVLVMPLPALTAFGTVLGAGRPGYSCVQAANLGAGLDGVQIMSMTATTHEFATSCSARRPILKLRTPLGRVVQAPFAPLRARALRTPRLQQRRRAASNRPTGATGSRSRRTCTARAARVERRGPPARAAHALPALGECGSGLGL